MANKDLDVYENAEHIDKLPWEVWIPIPEFEDYYLASNLGRIVGLRHRYGYRKELVIRKPSQTKDGYLHINITVKGKLHPFTAHKLIAITFLGDKPESSMEINHKNCIKTDNRSSNLEWVTRSEQQQHASKNGNSAFLKHPDSLVVKIRKEYRSGMASTAIAKKYNLSETTVYGWITGRHRGYGERENLSRGTQASGRYRRGSTLENKGGPCSNSYRRRAEALEK